MNKIIKGSLILGTISSIVSPIALVVSCGSGNESANQIDVSVAGKNFTQKSDLLEYIKTNAGEIEDSTKRNVFVVDLAGKNVTFSSKEKALEFIFQQTQGKEPLEVYLKVDDTHPRAQLIDEHGEIDYQNFLKKDETKLFYAFKTQNGQYKYISKKDATPEEIKDTEIEAAETYIEVHNAYYYDGIYFKTKADVFQYLMNHDSTIPLEDYETSLTSLYTEDGAHIEVDSKELTGKTIDQRKGGLLAAKVFENASPYYKSNAGSEVKLTDSNTALLASSLKERDLPYIKIESNEDKQTQIVDMDASTPSGSFHGSYYYQTGMGVSSIEDTSNWNQVSGATPISSSDLIDVSILKSSVNYVMKVAGISSPLEAFKIRLGADVTTVNGKVSYNFSNYPDFWTYLSKLKYKGYQNDVIGILKQLSKGTRYNMLDSIISIHSFLINEMIQQKEDVSSIYEVSKYFDSLSILLDKYLSSTLLTPFFTHNNNGGDVQNINVNYFENVFDFYNAENPGNSINFESNPYSYYRRLIGADDNNENNRGIFKIIEAAMGLQSISIRGLKHNQEVMEKWLGSAIYPGDVKFSKTINEGQFFDFTFKGKTADINSSEGSAIWKNIYDAFGAGAKGIKIKCSFDSKNEVTKEFSQEDLINNFNDYLLNVQNPKTYYYMERIKKTISGIKEQIFGETINPLTSAAIWVANEWIRVERFNDTNTIAFMQGVSDIPQEIIDDGIHNTNDKVAHLKQMIINEVEPLNERIKRFATKILTVTAQAAIAAVTGGVGAEEMIVEEETMHSAETLVQHSEKSFSATETSTTKSSNLGTTDIHSKEVSIDGHESSTTIEHKETFSTMKRTTSRKVTSDLKERLNNTFNSFANSGDFLPSQDKAALNLIKDSAEVAFNVIKNVIPGVSQLISVFTSFNRQEQLIYAYDQPEISPIYWDGGEVDYSWWGLSSTVKHDIKDLKVIVTPAIISGYKGTGFYYNGHIYSSLDSIRMKVATDMIEKYNSGVEADFWSGSQDKGVYWKISLKKKDDSLKEIDGSGIGELLGNFITFINDPKNVEQYSQKIYQLGFSLSTDETIKRELIQNFVDLTLKPITVIRLPKRESNILTSEVSSDSDSKFLLPGKVYFGAQNTIEESVSDPNEIGRYIVLNPNINPKNAALSGSSKVSGSLSFKLSELSKEGFSQENIHDLIIQYAKNILVPRKEVTLEEILEYSTSRKDDQIITNSFNNLPDEYVKHEETIYRAVDLKGEKHYYIDRESMMKEIILSDFYELSEINEINQSYKYTFDGKAFASYKDIYDYIVMKYGGENV